MDQGASKLIEQNRAQEQRLGDKAPSEGIGSPARERRLEPRRAPSSSQTLRRGVEARGGRSGLGPGGSWQARSGHRKERGSPASSRGHGCENVPIPVGLFIRWGSGSVSNDTSLQRNMKCLGHNEMDR